MEQRHNLKDPDVYQIYQQFRSDYLNILPVFSSYLMTYLLS